MRFLILTLFFLPGCAGLEVDPGYGGSAAEQAGAGFQTYESLHFIVMARQYGQAKSVADFAEEVYKRVMFDANLLSFRPRESYRIFVYENQEQFRERTGFPAWSSGGTVTELAGKTLPSEKDDRARTSIHTFQEVLTPPSLAHEIAHLVLNEFMRFSGPDHAERVRWLNEGFATFQELEAQDPAEKQSQIALLDPVLRQHAAPLEELMRFNPFRDGERILGRFAVGGKGYAYTNIHVWYWQARSLTGFLIKNHGRYNFFILMDALRQGKSMVQAFEAAYPGKWRDLAALESSWRQTLQ